MYIMYIQIYTYIHTLCIIKQRLTFTHTHTCETHTHSGNNKLAECTEKTSNKKKFRKKNRTATKEKNKTNSIINN